MARVVIVGAGLSGLTVAFRLRQRLPDIELTVLEGRSRAGGNIWTEYRDGYRVETGPNGFLDTKFSTIQLCRDLGLADRLIQGSEGARKNRYLLLNERLQKLPTSPLGIFTTSLLSLGGKLTLLKEPFRRRPQNLPADESVAAFARRRFGQEVADVFIDAIVTGIHAGDPEKLSLRAAFPRLAKFEAEAGSIFRGFLQSAKQRKTEQLARGDKPSSPRMWSFREGLRVLIEGLQEKIGTPITTGVAVKRIEQRKKEGDAA